MFALTLSTIISALLFCSRSIAAVDASAVPSSQELDRRITISGFLLDPSLLIPGRSKCNILNDINPFVPLSCHNTTVQTNLCCFNAPGGHFLQTQFWDYNSPVAFAGPNNSWTIHGMFFPQVVVCGMKPDHFFGVILTCRLSDLFAIGGGL